MLYRSNKIYVEESLVHGRGVFSSDRIKKGELLEECHFIKVPPDFEYPQILNDYFFSWPKGEIDGIVVCLGYGSIFNHSEESYNADWNTDKSKNKIIFFATRDIEPGEEIFINYKSYL